MKILEIIVPIVLIVILLSCMMNKEDDGFSVSASSSCNRRYEHQRNMHISDTHNSGTCASTSTIRTTAEHAPRARLGRTLGALGLASGAPPAHLGRTSGAPRAQLGR